MHNGFMEPTTPFSTDYVNWLADLKQRDKIPGGETEVTAAALAESLPNWTRHADLDGLWVKMGLLH